MHELSLCQGILDSLETAAYQQNFQRVRRVYLEIGALAGVDDEALQFGWESVSADSLAAGATLEITRVPGTAWCSHCQHSVQIEQYYDACPTCHQHGLNVTGGEQLKVKEIEVE